MRKKFYIIIGALIIILFLVFVLDNYSKSEFENPFRVGKTFSYSYMTKDQEHMKNWADKNTYKKMLTTNIKNHLFTIPPF